MKEQLVNLVYIGTSHVIIRKLLESRLFDLHYVICEDKRVSQLYIEVVQEYRLELLTFTQKSDFVRIIQNFKPDKFVYLIYQFDYIVPASITLKYQMFNLHAGNLKTNRGAHPLIWSILNGDTETELTLHQINEKIDQGIIVGTYTVKIDSNDNTISLKIKMEIGLIQLINKLILFLKGDIEGEICTGGIYRKPITENDFTIDLLNDSRSEIENKIRSQKQYFGAVIIFNENKYYVNKLIYWKEEMANEVLVLIEKNQFIVKRLNCTFQFEINYK
jgi:methionyl-tRNA formyltransferase